jgi:hypothetical protein
MYCTNTTGFKGVYSTEQQDTALHMLNGRPNMYLNNRKISLGYYLTKEEAAAAYAEASNRLHGEFVGQLQ